MGVVVSFVDYRPAARFDDVPWTEAQIEEAASASGPWTVIDMISLTPADVDPSAPQLRSFTTDEGTGPDLWYRVTFVDAGSGTSQPTDPVHNSSAAVGRDLCTLADVVLAVPGYDDSLPSNASTNAKLQDLITSESQLIHDQTGREIVGLNADARDFVIDSTIAFRTCRVPVGDLASLEDAVIEVLSGAGTVVATVDPSHVDAIYGVRRYPVHEWDPITELEMLTVRGAPALAPGQLLRVTGAWGFPEIPAFIRTAAVNRTILRYISDVAPTGTQFAEAAGELNLAAMFASARDAVEEIKAVFVA